MANLHKAISENDLDSVASLLESPDIDVNEACDMKPFKWTPLHRAAILGHTGIVSLLLSKGADKRATDRDGLTPMKWAARFGRTDIVKLLK